MLAAAAPAGRPERSGLSEDRLADCQLAVRARQALHQDELLASFNLGVSVRDHVATLWGALPSQDLLRRAEERVRQVQGVAEIRNQLRVEPQAGATESARPLPRQEPLAPAAPPTGGTLTALPVEDRPVPARSVPPPVVVTLRPPTASIALVPPPVAPTPPAVLISTIDRLRLADPRFRQVRADVQDGVVHLGGTVARWEDLLELAQAVARLPGVERVILGEVRTARPAPLAVP
jgi:hypothetical protein